MIRGSSTEHRGTPAVIVVSYEEAFHAPFVNVRNVGNYLVVLV